MANSDKFTREKQLMIVKLTHFLHDYDEFTKSVAPQNYRTTGHHFTELRNMMETISEFEEITAGQLDLLEQLTK